MGTAGLARCLVRGYRRDPAPPPRITAAILLVLMETLLPSGALEDFSITAFTCRCQRTGPGPVTLPPCKQAALAKPHSPRTDPCRMFEGNRGERITNLEGGTASGLGDAGRGGQGSCGCSGTTASNGAATHCRSVARHGLAGARGKGHPDHAWDVKSQCQVDQTDKLSSCLAIRTERMQPLRLRSLLLQSCPTSRASKSRNGLAKHNGTARRFSGPRPAAICDRTLKQRGEELR